jgi:hypothetical protein
MTFADAAEEAQEWWADGAWHYVSSSNVDAFMYERDTQSLFIRFHGNRTYKYFNISPELASGLASAPSPGGWFHSTLKGAPFERV